MAFHLVFEKDHHYQKVGPKLVNAKNKCCKSEKWLRLRNKMNNARER
jgi:hypothetical protein